MPVLLQALIVDSQPEHVERIARELRRADFAPDYQRIETEAEFLSQLTEKLDLIIADCTLFDGGRALRHLQERGLNIPFIAVAGDIGEEAAARYIRLGAADFVHRDRLERLGEAVREALQAKDEHRPEHASQIDETCYRSSAELTTDCAYILNVALSGDLTVEWIADSFGQLTGFTLEEARRDWSRLIHPEDVMIVQSRMKGLLAGKPEATEYRFLTKAGGIRWVHDRSRPVLNQGRVTRIYGAVQDITRHKREIDELQRINAELEEYLYERTAELHRQHTLLQTILDSMGEGVLYSKDFRIRYVNRALAELTSYRIEELTDQPNSILKSERASDEDARLLTEEVAELGLTRRGETKIRRKDGTEFDAALTVTLMTQPKGEIIGAVTIVRDITAEKQLQEQKTRFIANASHELRTPLTNIKTRLYLMQKQPGRINEHALALERAADRMADLVEDLLDISRFERGVIQLSREPVVLQKLVVDVAESQQPEAARKGITLATEIPDSLVLAHIDQKRILQVITNLVINAINYTPEGGHVSIHLLTGDGNGAIIRVRDTGIGIGPENLARVFEPFFRVNENAGRGTGLGLSISREIVTLHGGTLTVESKLGEGSMFTITLPLS